MQFNEAFDRVIGHEGGYVNDPRDPGGETKYGISKRAYPNEDIANLTLDQARVIYKRDYWDRCQCDQLPQEIRGFLFDAAINSGVYQSIKWLQRSALVTNVDGVIGAKTIAACRFADPLSIVVRFIGHRLDFLNDNPEQWQRYGRGWVQRIATDMIRI